MKRPDDFPFLVKICGITAAEDGQAAVDAGANALGFNFYKRSPRYVTPQRAKDLIGQISGRYLRVGVFVNATEADLVETARVAGLDVLQLHGDVPAALPANLRVWRAAAANALPELSDRFEAYLLDSPCSGFGGSGVSFDWSLVSAFPGRSILAGGLHAGNVREAMAAAQPSGVDACSRLEAAPGRKDRELVETFVQAALDAHRQLITNEMIVTI